MTGGRAPGLTLVWMFHHLEQLPNLKPADSGRTKKKSIQLRCATTRVALYIVAQLLSFIRLYHDGKLLIKGHKETIDTVMLGQFAYLVEKLTALKVLVDDFDTNGRCGFYLTAKPLFSMPYGMIFPESEGCIAVCILKLLLTLIRLIQKGSPYVNLVNEKLHLLHENGLLDMWTEEVVAEASKCNTVSKAVSSHGETNVKLTMEYVDSIFLIFWGFSLAVCGFIVEIIKAKCFPSQNTK